MRKDEGRRIWAALAGALLALVVAVVLITTASNRAERLEEIGDRVPGSVIDFDRGFRAERNWVTFQYTYGGQVRDQRMPVSGRYAEGSAVEVVVDPSDASRAIIAGERPQSSPAYWASIAGVVLGLGGLVWFVSQSIQRRRSRRAL